MLMCFFIRSTTEEDFVREDLIKANEFSVGSNYVEVV